MFGYNYQHDTIHQRIPHDCMAPIEKWVLTRLFDSRVEGDGTYFYTSLLTEFDWETDEQFVEALSCSRDICPELCDAAERAVEQDGYIDLLKFECVDILKSIVKRNSSRLPYISMETAFGRPEEQGVVGGRVILVLPDRIESMTTWDWLDERLAS